MQAKVTIKQMDGTKGLFFVEDYLFARTNGRLMFSATIKDVGLCKWPVDECEEIKIVPVRGST